MSKTLNQDWLLNRSIKLLEFNDLLSFLTEYTKTEPGRKKALNLLPSQNLKEIEKNLDLLREMIALKNSGLTLPLSYFPDLRESFENAQKGVRLSVPELVEILKFVVQADKILEFCKALAKKFPIIAELGLSSPKFSQLKNALEKCFDEQGELKDSASQKLKELRSEHNSLRTQIQKNLEQILSSREYESIIQDKFYRPKEELSKALVSEFKDVAFFFDFEKANNNIHFVFGPVRNKEIPERIPPIRLISGESEMLENPDVGIFYDIDCYTQEIQLNELELFLDKGYNLVKDMVNDVTKYILEA